MKQPHQLSRTIRLLGRGRITIPAAFRERMGMEEHCVLRVTFVGDELRIRQLAEPEAGQGSPWLRVLYDYFAPVREEILARGISEEEVNAAIDEALAEVRRTPGP